MEQESTPQRLLRQAEALMAQKGIAATSVREITDAAEANVAAVNYYFGSKSELLLALLKTRFEQLDKVLFDRLEAVEARSRGEPVAVADLAFAYFDALARLGINNATGALDPFILLIQRASAEQEAVLVRAQDYGSPGITRLIDRLAATSPGVDRDRIHPEVLAGLMFTTTVDALEAMAQGPARANLVAAIRAFLAAGVEAYLHSLQTAETTEPA